MPLGVQAAAYWSASTLANRPSLAGQPNRIRLPFTVNEGISQMLWVAKKAVAFFKMSRSIRSR
jgi:hypothetical protein